MKLTPQMVRAGLAAAAIPRARLIEEAAMGDATLRRFMAGQSVSARIEAAMSGALGRRGVTFHARPDGWEMIVRVPPPDAAG